MRRIDFEKLENGKWYVVMDHYEGDHEDLEMVEGADTFLDLITEDDMYASILLYDDEPTIGTYSYMELLSHDVDGATYQVYDCAEYAGTVWLCNVAHLFFKGEHPETIYFNVNYEF